MNLDRNICTKCSKKNFSDSEYDSEAQMCNDCFEQEKNSEAVILFSPDILKKDMFETTQEYQERVKNLGWLEVGEVTLNSYDADTEMFTIALSLNHYITFKTQEIQIMIKREEAKPLYETSKTYKLLAQIAVADGAVSFKELKFQDYDIQITSFYKSFYWTDKDSGLIWEIKQNNTIDKLYTWDQALNYAQELNTKNYCGFNDWRVPTIDELNTLVPKTSYKGIDNKDVYIKKPLINNTYSSSYWSSSVPVSYYNFAWYMNFNSGSTNGSNKSTKHYMRCVKNK